MKCDKQLVAYSPTLFYFTENITVDKTYSDCTFWDWAQMGLSNEAGVIYLATANVSRKL